MPKVSIIMPVYNKETYLNDSINAIISQKYIDWELLVINDGSTDGSLDIIKKYERGEPRIKVINQNNMGVSEARNAGIDKASGEWIWFVDADDLPNRDFLSAVFSDNNMLNQKIDIVVGNFERFEGIEQISKVVIDEEGVISASQFPDLFMKYQYKNGFWGYLWNKLIRKSLLKIHKFCVGLTLAEDLKLMTELYRSAKYIFIIPQNAMRYTVNALNASTEKKIDYCAQMKIQLDICDWILHERNNCKYKEYFDSLISRYAAYIVYYGFENGKDPRILARKLKQNPEIGQHFTTDNVEKVMIPIVWCLKHNANELMIFYLNIRAKLKSAYHMIKGGKVCQKSQI